VRARLTFVSYGAGDGDAKWLDHQGSFMAAVARSGIPAAGREGLGVKEDYHTAQMPR